MPKGKRMGKLMLASVELTLQKVEMLGRARHRAREMLHVPTEVCAFSILKFLLNLSQYCFCFLGVLGGFFWPHSM